MVVLLSFAHFYFILLNCGEQRVAARQRGARVSLDLTALSEFVLNQKILPSYSKNKIRSAHCSELETPTK